MRPVHSFRDGCLPEIPGYPALAFAVAGIAVIQMLEVPNADRAVPPGGGKKCSLGAEIHVANGTGMPAQRSPFFVPSWVPDFDQAHFISGNEDIFAGMTSHAPYRDQVAFQDAGFTGAGVPNTDGFVLAGGSKIAAVGIEGHFLNAVFMPAELLDLFAQGHIPDDNGLILRTGRQTFAIATERQTNNG